MIENLKIALRKQQKLIALFLLTIFLPSVFLSIFGIRAIRSEHFRFVKQVENEQAQVADLCKAQVRSRVEAVETLLQTLVRDPVLSGGDYDVTRQLLGEQLAEDPLVEQVFIIYEDEEPVFPLVQSRLEDGSSRGASRFSGSAQLQLKEAEELEFVRKEFRAAISIYDQVLDETRDKNDRALVLSRVARNLTKLKEYRGAIETYSRIQTDYPESRTSSGVPLALIAGLEKADCYRMLGEQARLLQTALEVYDDVVNDSWGLSETQFKAYASLGKEAVANALVDLGGEVPDDENYGEEFEELKVAHWARTEQWEVIAVLKRESLPELRRKFNEFGSFSEFPLRQANTVGERDLLITSLMIPDEGRRSALGLLGVKLCNEYLEGGLLTEIAGEIGIGQNTTLTISNLSGRVLYGPPIPSGDNVKTAAFFEENYPPWRMELTDLELKRSGFPAIHTSFYFWTILTLIVVLVFGVLLVARTVGHEMELLKIKSDFVSSVSHEFKTPLTSIKALTERLLEGKVRQPGKMKEYFSVISQDTEKLARLVGNLLDFSRIEEGRKEYEMLKTDVAEWLRETVDGFRNESIERHVTIRTHIPDDVPDLHIDRAAMSQAVANLLDNAIKFSPENKKVDLIVESDQRRVVFKIKDYGIGISENDQARVFEKFYQGKAAPGQSARGTGLGLTLVKHTVEGHGGSVTVESQAGEGSTFTLSLPIQENAG